MGIMEELTQEERIAAEKFHYLIDRNMKVFHKWWEPTSCGMNTDVSEELNNKILEHTKNISVNGAQVVGYYGLTIFHQLVCHNYFEAVKILLKKGVDPNVRGAEGKGDYKDSHKGVTPLHLACHSGNYEMVRLLLEYGADTSLCDEMERNCFHFLASAYYQYVCCYSESRNYELMNQRLAISELLKCDINKRDRDGVTPLMRIMQNEYKEFSMILTKKYLEYGADVTIADNEGNTVLMTAVENKHITATDIFVQYPELINKQNNNGDTALHKAFLGNKWNPAAGYMLVEAGADIYIKNNAGETVAEYIRKKAESSHRQLEEKCIFKKPLSFEDYFRIIDDFACDWWGGKNDDYSVFVHRIVRSILRKIDKDDDTELVYAKQLMKKLLWGRDEGSDAIQIFYEEDFDLCMPICEGRYVTTLRDMCIEASWNDLEILPKLMELGIDLNEALVDGYTPAAIVADRVIRPGAGEHVHEGVAKVYDFFDKESMEALNNEGKAAIHLAVWDNCYTLVESMIKKGVDINITADAKDNLGNTPLHIACIRQNVKIAQMLIEAGADDSIINAAEETPAHYLFANYRDFDSDKCYEIMGMLKNVDTPKAKTGETPLILLLKKDPVGVKEITELLLSKGANVNCTDMKGNTPLLIHAEHRCNKDVVKMMLNAGADINARNAEGNSVLHYVLRHGDCELARLLIKKGADYNVVNLKGESPVDIAVENGYGIVLELMTDIKVHIAANESFMELENDDRMYRPEGYDDYDDEGDYEEDEEESYDEEQLEAMRAEHEYQIVLKAYSDTYGAEKGKRLADIVIRMSRMNQKGLTQENMEEYMRLTAEFQVEMQGGN